jgi:hypothetical protein
MLCGEQVQGSPNPASLPGVKFPRIAVRCSVVKMTLGNLENGVVVVEHFG